MHRVARSINAFFDDIDIWINPSLGLPPVDLGSFAQNKENPMAPLAMAAEFSPTTAIFNISGQPAASVPIHWNEQGLPIGVQVVAKFGDEATIFQLAKQMEEAVNWVQYQPKLVKS